MSERRNEGEVKRDFAKAIQGFDQALSEVMFGITKISQTLAQMLVSIRKHKEQLSSGVQSAMTGGRADATSPLAPDLAKGLDQQLKVLSQQNQELQSSLEQLRSLEGKLPLDNVQDLKPRLDALDRSIQMTSEQNKQLSNTLPQPTPHESKQLEKENLKAAFLGQKLDASSQEEAMKVKGQLDSTLSELSHQVQKLRVTKAPEEPTVRPEDKDLPKPYKKTPGPF